MKQKTPISIKFFGGAGTVTGSKTLLTCGKTRVLIDCGLFQGLKELRLQNWDEPKFSVSSIDAVILTHAHLDHCGYLPILSNNGFVGPIFTTPPTCDLAALILRDSAKLQEEDAEHANKRGYSKHHPAKPLYTDADVRSCLRLFNSVAEGQWFDLADGIRFRFLENGHILGSSFVELDCQGRIIVFSGDLGRPNSTLLRPPKKLEKADYLIVESTYGDRCHPKESALDALKRSLIAALARGGSVLIPSFSVGRAQELIYLLYLLKRQKVLSDVPIDLDSPMAIEATGIMGMHPDWHQLSHQEWSQAVRGVNLISDYHASLANAEEDSPRIVIAGSGMVAGGRILNYLEKHLGDPRATVLLTGFQAVATRGRLLQDGVTEIKFHGRYLPVRAHVETIESLSAHADQGELLDWLRGLKHAPKRVFINHGEPQAADALRVKITDQLSWPCVVAKMSQEYSLD